MNSEISGAPSHTWSWDDMVEEFRALGGTAENVTQRTGAYGYGLFPIDPSKPIDLHAPEKLLIPKKWVREDGPNLVVDEASGLDSRIRAFFTRYQQAFSWGREGRQSALTWIEHLEGLGEAVKRCVQEKLCVNLAQEDPGTGPAIARFLATRTITYRDEPVLMPVVELVNHAPHSASWDMREGIRVTGKYTDEIRVRYSVSDSLMRYFSHGFVCDEKRAFSLPLAFNGVFGVSLIVRRHTTTTQKTNYAGTLLPTVESTNQGIVVSYVLLGDAFRPSAPRSIFRRIFPHLKPEQADQLFQLIAATNIRYLVNALDELDGQDSSFCRQLRRVIRLQLTALADSYGVEGLDARPTSP